MLSEIGILGRFEQRNGLSDMTPSSNGAGAPYGMNRHLGTGWEVIAMIQMQRDGSWYQDGSDEVVRSV